MKLLKHPLYLLGACALATSASGAINIQTSFVGNSGNSNSTNGYGGVSYDYHVGTYEVTNSQYVAFLNAKASTNAHGVYNPNMTSNSLGGILQSGTGVGGDFFTYESKSGWGNKPVNYVSFWDAARFSNWLTNGQGSGDTESGMYNLGGVTNPTNTSVTRQLDFSTGQNGVAITSEDEWHKAAYYSGSPTGGLGAGYWAFPTASASIPTGNEANYNANDGNEPDLISNVGYSVASPYDTFDQGGNVWEWNEGISSTSTRVLRGGSYGTSFTTLQAGTRNSTTPSNEFGGVGFRVSSLAPIVVPSELKVSAFSYDKTADTLTLTWDSTAPATYSINYTEDLTTPFTGLLSGNIPSGGVSTTYGPVASPLPNATKLFFQISENAQ